MDIEKILKKLRPLMSEQVRQWEQIRNSCDVDFRRALDTHIDSVAQDRFGGIDGKILLSHPPRAKAQGEINLGAFLYDKEKWPVGIAEHELLQNMAVFGRSGAGKTNFTFHLLNQLADKNINFLFLDWKMTARHLLPRLKRKVNVYTAGRSLSKLAFNPFVVPPGIESHVYISHLVDSLADSFTLGDGAKRILQKAIMNCCGAKDATPVVGKIIQAIDEIPGKGRVQGWKISALRAIESLEFAGIGVEAVPQKTLVQRLLNESSIIELESLSANCKRFLVPLLCHWMYQVRLTKPDREQLRFVIFIEEAHHVLHQGTGRSKETLMEMLLRQFREIGIAAVIVDQHPSLISSAVLGNTYTSVVLNLKDPSDINKAAGISSVDTSEKHYFSRLPVGQGIVKLQDRWTRPFLVRFPLVPVEKGRVSDKLLMEYLKDPKVLRKRGADSRGKTSDRGEIGEFGQVQLSDGLLDERSLAFIRDVLKHADDGVKVRYVRLGLSVGTGTKIKEGLVQSGIIEQEVVSLGTTRKNLLRLTGEGREVFGVKNGAATNESMKHEYWKRVYASRFGHEGYKVQFEVPRKSGRVDVVALREGEAIAIEVETGKSNVVKNVRDDLLEGFGKVIVVATDKVALRKVERDLGRAGLIIPGRVEVVLGTDLETLEFWQ